MAPAFRDNTKFLYTYFGSNAEKATFQFRRSGYWADVPIMCAGLDSQVEGAPKVVGIDFLASKILPVYEMCTRLKNKGIEYIFFMDSTDILFTKKQEAIFAAFNKRYKQGTVLGTALFSKPALAGHIHCNILDAFVHHWYNRAGYRCVLCNPFAGHIDTMIHMFELAIEYAERPMPVELGSCPDCMTKTRDDLMLIYRIHKDYPDLFDCDANQEVFSYYWNREEVSTMTVAKLCDDRRHPDNTIGDAKIIHGSGHFHENQPLANLWRTLPEAERWSR